METIKAKKGKTISKEHKDYLKAGEDIPANNKKPLDMKPTAADKKDDGGFGDMMGMM